MLSLGILLAAVSTEPPPDARAISQHRKRVEVLIKHLSFSRVPPREGQNGPTMLWELTHVYKGQGLYSPLSKPQEGEMSKTPPDDPFALNL